MIAYSKLLVLIATLVLVGLYQNCSNPKSSESSAPSSPPSVNCNLSDEASLPSHIQEVYHADTTHRKFVVMEEDQNTKGVYYTSNRFFDWSFDKYENGEFVGNKPKESGSSLLIVKNMSTSACIERRIKAKIRICDKEFSDFPEVIARTNCPIVDPPPPPGGDDSGDDSGNDEYSCNEAWSFGRTRQAKPAKFIDAFPNGAWPYSGTGSDGVGSSSPIAVKRGKYVAIEFTPSLMDSINNYMIGMIEAQGSIAPATGVYVTISKCPGDARVADNNSMDHLLRSGCRKYGGTMNFGYTVSSTLDSTSLYCVVRPGEKHYLNIFLFDPRDGVTPEEHTCLDPEEDSCGKRFKFN